MVNAWLNWTADRHTCGRPLSEMSGPVRPSYVVSESECLGCKAVSEHVKSKHKDGMPTHVMLQVHTRDEAMEAMKQRGG